MYVQVHKDLAASYKEKNIDKSGPHIRTLSESLRMMFRRGKQCWETDLQPVDVPHSQSPPLQALSISCFPILGTPE